MDNQGGPACAILTYHSQNVGAGRSPVNDHEALRMDLQALTQAGLQTAPLAAALAALESDGDCAEAQPLVCLTFDDGCDLDVRDIDFPEAGPQRSLLGIMEDFVMQHGAHAQPGLHATSFVIASAEARCVIDRNSLFGRGWMSDDWWQAANDHPLLSLGNHGLDHNHPDLDAGDAGRGGFESVDNLQACREQVVNSAKLIERRTGAWPEFFAYPFGESSSFLREQYFPAYAAEHRCRAALGTEPGLVTPACKRWNLPRFVCGRDWRSSDQLLGLLESQSRFNR